MGVCPVGIQGTLNGSGMLAREEANHGCRHLMTYVAVHALRWFRIMADAAHEETHGAAIDPGQPG